MIKIKLLLLVASLLITSLIYSQREEQAIDISSNKSSDPAKIDTLKNLNPTIYSYQYWTEDTPKSIFDTVLTIDKYYKNRMYNHKDDFGTIPFSNIGEAFNPLLYNTKINSSISLVPQGKSYNLLDVDQVRYYDVKTPMTEFQYNNGYKQGHSLSTMFTHNINSQFNYSIQYKGLRSEGKYLDQLASNNTFLVTTNYHTKNLRYKFWAHYLITNANNEENGGIQNLKNFEDGDSRFTSRNRLQVNLTDAYSKYEQRRFYLAQQFGLVPSKENTYVASIKNIFSYETMHYTYEELKTLNTYYSSVENMYGGSNLAEHYNTKEFRKFSNQTMAVLDLSDRLYLEAGVKYEHLEFNFDRLMNPAITTIPEKIKDDRIGVAGNLTFNWNKGIVLTSQGEALTGNQFNNSYYINNRLTLQPFKGYFIEANLGVKSQIPSINVLYNQSFYKQFNYFIENPENETTIQMGGALRMKPFNTRFTVQFFNIDNYTYLDGEYAPKQSSTSVNLAQIGLKNSFQYKKFHLETALAYQNVTRNKEILPLPEFIGRATFYYQSKIFKEKAEVQAGINAYYFSKFKSRMFFPVTNEFKLQSGTENYRIGEYPLLDLFIHFKVKRMLFIFEAQHFNSSLSGYDFYSTPLNPYTDFRLNIGILWYLFT